MEDESLGGSALVGRLSKTPSRTGDTISFEYDPDWLAGAGPVTAFPLDHKLYVGAGQQYASAGAHQLSGARRAQMRRFSPALTSLDTH